MNTIIRYQPHTPAGRAIGHLLDTVLADRGLTVSWDGHGDRRLIVHPSLDRTAGDAVGSILMLVESLAGTGAVNLQHLYAIADQHQREHIALAVFMAAGYEVATTAGKRRAS